MLLRASSLFHRKLTIIIVSTVTYTNVLMLLGASSLFHLRCRRCLGRPAARYCVLMLLGASSLFHPLSHMWSTPLTTPLKWRLNAPRSLQSISPSYDC